MSETKSKQKTTIRQQQIVTVEALQPINVRQLFNFSGTSIEKTAQYWPEEVDKSLAFDQMEITLLEQTEVFEEELICRKLQVKSKTISQCLNVSRSDCVWPCIVKPKGVLVL